MWDTNTIDGVIVIRLDVASLDASNAAEAKSFFKTLDLTGCDRAALDLQDVQFIDSSGIGAILSFYKQMNQQMVLRNVSPSVLSVLELLRLHRVFEIESD